MIFLLEILESCYTSKYYRITEFLHAIESQKLLKSASVNYCFQVGSDPTNIYLFNVSNGKTRPMCEICSKLFCFLGNISSLRLKQKNHRHNVFSLIGVELHVKNYSYSMMFAVREISEINF